MELTLPEYVFNVIALLQRHGYEAYVVGGCVRDSLLGLAPSDWDVCTDAHPDRVTACFKSAGYHCIPTGIKHGTVTVVSNQDVVEVTTFRTDQNYRDHRRPDAVLFSDTLQDDLTRRDFTINAMAWNPQTGLTDLFGGMDDLRAGILRCVGNPLERFSEDALRILRLFRFAAQLNFDPEPKTLEAAVHLRDDLQYLSGERTGAELTKLLCSLNPGRILRLMDQTGVLQRVFPVSGSSIQEYPPRNWNAVDRSISDEVVRYAVFLHLYLPPPVTADALQAVLKRLRRSRQLSRRVCDLFEACRQALLPDARLLRRLLSRYGEQTLRDLIEVKRALVCASDIGEISKISELMEAVLAAKPCLQIHDLAVSGSDMIALGLEGPKIGRMLRHLLDLVLDDPHLNRRDILLLHARNEPEGRMQP